MKWIWMLDKYILMRHLQYLTYISLTSIRSAHINRYMLVNFGKHGCVYVICVVIQD